MPAQHKRNLKNILLLFIAVIVSIVFSTKVENVQAAISSCTVSASPTDPEANVQVGFTLSLTNNDGINDINWFQITKPHTGTTFRGQALFPAWYPTYATDTITNVVFQTPLAAGGTISPVITLEIGDIGGESGSWGIQVSDDAGGANPVTCVGSLSFAVTGGTDQTAPTISAISLSGLTTSQVTASWTTDEAANSFVEYGLESGGYPLNKTSATLTTSHSVTIDSGVAAGTTYYYRICSTDETGNQACSGEGSFTTTSTSDATPVPTVAPTVTAPTVTASPTPTPSPTPPPVDRTPPRVIIETDLSKPFEISPLIKGRATDNKAVTSVEYSTDGGRNWIPVDVIESVGEVKTNFEFIPFLNEDGNYLIQVRAKDKRGNTGKSREETLVIDRLPPLVGGNLIALGPQPLMPNSDGTVVALAGLEQKITLSAVGGPTSIDLFVGEQKIALDYSPETSLWSGFLDLDEVGTYVLSTEAVDGANNRTTRDLNPIQVVGAGQVIDKKTGLAVTKGKISVFVRDDQTRLWNLWDAQAFSQRNPQSLNNNGIYQFFLPPGTYYLQVESAGFNTLKSHIFSLAESRPINADFLLEDGRTIRLGTFRIALPVFMQKTLEIDLSLPEIESVSETVDSDLLGQVAPSFSLEIGDDQFQPASLRGQTSIISFVNTWSPPSVEQISVINSLVKKELVPITMIATQETYSKVAIFRQRGDYQTPIWVDPDGELVEKYQLTTTPTHLVLDRRGKVIKILTQVLSEDQLLALLSSAD